MGGCGEGPDACTNKTCHRNEVDIMHFSLGNAIPGRLYGGNPVDNSEGYGGDRFGHLVDMYDWNPHCRFPDGISPSGNDTSAQNDWQGSWWHSSLTDHSGLSYPVASEDRDRLMKESCGPSDRVVGQVATGRASEVCRFIKDDSPYYYFEFSRPLRTMDRVQQDAQFTIGKSSKFAAAFWYPMDGKPWHGSRHYSISCDWIPLDFISGSIGPTKVVQRSSWNAATVFSLLFSVAALCISIFIGHRMSKTSRTSNFMPMDNQSVGRFLNWHGMDGPDGGDNKNRIEGMIHLIHTFGADFFSNIFFCSDLCNNIFGDDCWYLTLF
ncbi:hypothetical protein OROGR_024802 [Orobanche gracilis]